MGRKRNTIGKSSSNAVVVGLGKNAIACAAYLIDEGWDVEMLDVKPHPHLERLVESELPGIMIHTAVDRQVLANADLVVISWTTVGASGVEVLELAKRYGSRVVTSLELFIDRSSKPVIAIAGSNGKSTVAALVRSIAESCAKTVCIDSRFGHPILELLNNQQPDAYIVELTPQQLGQIHSVSPDIVALLNCWESREGTMDDGGSLHNEDMERVAGAAAVSIINRDDPVISGMSISGTRIGFGTGKAGSDSDFGVDEEDSNRWGVKGATRLVDFAECALRGRHNELNILAAYAIADAAGFPIERARQAIAQFQSLPYSCDDEGEWNGVRWVNDARSTNVAAAIAAIESAAQPVVLIAGGLSQGDDFSRIARKVNGQLRGCVLFGRDGWEIGKSFNGIQHKEHVENIDDAIAVAEQIASAGDCVVFSPGCASHDMFSDYEQRGESFSQALRSRFS